MFTTYLGIEERMDREGWDEEEAALLGAATRQLEEMDD